MHSLQGVHLRGAERATTWAGELIRCDGQALDIRFVGIWYVKQQLTTPLSPLLGSSSSFRPVVDYVDPPGMRLLQSMPADFLPFKM